MLNSIQFLRAIAAWIVVGHHFMQVFFGFQRQNLVGNFFSDYGALGVDLFFIISGFVIYHATADKAISPSQFLVARIIRIAPAYWVFSIITALVIYFFNGFIPLTQFESSFFLKGLFFIPAANPSGIGYYPLLTPGWSLNFELAFYTIFGLALFFAGKNRLLVIILGVFILQKLVPILGAPWDFYKNKIVFEFLFGIVVAVIYRKNLISHITKTISLFLLLLAIIIIATKGHTHDFLYTGVPSALIVIAVLSQEKLFQRHSFLISLGNWSYSTYLCHMLVLSGAFYLYKMYHLPLDLIVIIVITGILVVSMASYSLIESCASKWLKEKFQFMLIRKTSDEYKKIEE